MECYDMYVLTGSLLSLMLWSSSGRCRAPRWKQLQSWLPIYFMLAHTCLHSVLVSAFMTMWATESKLTLLLTTLWCMQSAGACTVPVLKVFREFKEDTLSWNSIILGQMHKHFSQYAHWMSQTKWGSIPVLIACAIRQLAQECLNFESMKSVHNLEPPMKHYCLQCNWSS